MSQNPEPTQPEETVPFPVTPEPAPHGDPVAPDPPVPPPADETPGYAQPIYTEPVPAQPSYAQPVYAQPGYPRPVFAQPPYAQLSYPSPYGQPGYHPAAGGYSDKSKVVAGLLQLLLPFLGICGVGRLYAGHVGLGLAQLLGMFIAVLLAFVLIGFVIVPLIWLWTVIDGIVILTGDTKDGQGRLLRP